MNYQQTLDYLFSQLPMFQRIGKAAYKANLDNTLALDKHFGHPHKQFKSIHIAGTNGKGSTSHMLASILFEAGYKVGLYTSPHLKDFRERIRVNGEMISQEYVVDFVSKNQLIFEDIKPSFFEMTVAMAFEYFAQQKIDIAVVEVGLGGRLDSTNIITPILSVITNIGFDHTDLLGDTLEKIAAEKAGIIKPNVPVVISQTQLEIKTLFEQRSKELNAPIHFADEIFTIDCKGVENNLQEFTVEDNSHVDTVYLDLLGSYQLFNLKGVLGSIEVLNQNGLKISSASIKDGLAKTISNTGLLGRWQVISRNPKIICDTGHNAHGLTQTMQQLLNQAFQNLHIVIGMVADKNIDSVLELLPKTARYYFTRASIPRALNEVELANRAKIFGLTGSIHPTVSQAIESAKSNANSNDLIFIGGSTFVVADALKYFD